MNIYLVVTILITLSAVFAYLNQKFLRLPFVIGLFLISTVLSLIVLSSKYWLNVPLDYITGQVESLHIEKVIIDYLLGFLLFAGALHTDWKSIQKSVRAISVFAVAGVMVSTVIIAFLTYFVSDLFNVSIDFVSCLLFGALISPTDPIAVLGILTKANVSKHIESTIVGESLFNDGIGVVVFLALLQSKTSGVFSVELFSTLFFQEAIGGVILGILFGYVLHMLLKSIDHYETEILLTIAFVMSGYWICNFLHTSGALAMVVMGLMTGNFKQNLAMSDTTQEYVHKFWELVDVILNAILFLLIGFILLIIEIEFNHLMFGLITIMIVLVSRLVVVFIPIFSASKFIGLKPRDGLILTWGGLRGGLSIALVLSLPQSEIKNVLLIITYCCVLFSIIIQGLTIQKLANSNAV